MSNVHKLTPTNGEAMSQPPVSAEQVLAAVHNAQDQIANMHGQMLTGPDIAKAVAEGLTQAVSSPEFWTAAIAAASSRAKNEAGSWLFGGIGAVLSKLGWLLVIGLGIYLIGGWSALVAFMKSGGAH